jgi:hypothetical protein
MHWRQWCITVASCLARTVRVKRSTRFWQIGSAGQLLPVTSFLALNFRQIWETGRTIRIWVVSEKCASASTQIFASKEQMRATPLVLFRTMKEFGRIPAINGEDFVMSPRPKDFMPWYSENDTRFLARPRPPRVRDVKITLWAVAVLVLLAIAIDAIRLWLSR